MKTVFEYVGAAVIGGAFVFMIVWAASQTDPQYCQPPSYVARDWKSSEAAREGWMPITNRED